MAEKLRIGVSYPLQMSRHLRSDFEKIKSSGVNSILLAVSEDSLAYNFEGVRRGVSCAKKVFDYVSFNFWAMGGIFGGEASSYFLQRYPQESQKFNVSRGAEGAACPQSKLFREYYFNLIREIIDKTEVDEVFIDEPHWPTFRRDNRKIDDSVFSCSCPNCRERFLAETGFDIPKKKGEGAWDEFVLYRGKIMIEFLRDIISVIKSCERKVVVNLCVHPKNNWVYGSPKLEDIFGMDDVGIVSIDPYHFKYGINEGMKYVLLQVRDILKMRKGTKKEVQVWVQGFKVPGGREEEIGDIIRLIYEEGIRNIQFWSYGNEAFSSIGCDDFEKVWDSLKKAYLKLRA